MHKIKLQVRDLGLHWVSRMMQTFFFPDLEYLKVRNFGTNSISVIKNAYLRLLQYSSNTSWLRLNILQFEVVEEGPVQVSTLWD